MGPQGMTESPCKAPSNPTFTVFIHTLPAGMWRKLATRVTNIVGRGCVGSCSKFSCEPATADNLPVEPKPDYAVTMFAIAVLLAPFIHPHRTWVGGGLMQQAEKSVAMYRGRSSASFVEAVKRALSSRENVNVEWFCVGQVNPRPTIHSAC